MRQEPKYHWRHIQLLWSFPQWWGVSKGDHAAPCPRATCAILTASGVEKQKAQRKTEAQEQCHSPAGCGQWHRSKYILSVVLRYGKPDLPPDVQVQCKRPAVISGHRGSCFSCLVVCSIPLATTSPENTSCAQHLPGCSSLFELKAQKNTVLLLKFTIILCVWIMSLCLALVEHVLFKGSRYP